MGRTACTALRCTGQLLYIKKHYVEQMNYLCHVGRLLSVSLTTED